MQLRSTNHSCLVLQCYKWTLWIADPINTALLSHVCTQVCVGPSQAWHLPFSPLYNVLHHINHIISGGPLSLVSPVSPIGLVGHVYLVCSLWVPWVKISNMKNLESAHFTWTSFSLYSITFTTTMRIQPALAWKLCWKKLEDIWFVVQVVQPFLSLHVSQQHMHNWHQHWSKVTSALPCMLPHHS